MLHKSLYQSWPHYHFHRRRWYIMGSHVNVDHKLSLNGRKESCAGFAHWLTARDWHVRFSSRPSLVTSSFQTPSWRKCSARGFVTGHDEAPGAVTEVTSIFLTGYDFIARGAGGGPSHFACHSSDSIPQRIIFILTHSFAFKVFLVGTRKERKYLLHVLKKLHSGWLDGTYPQSAGEKPSSCWNTSVASHHTDFLLKSWVLNSPLPVPSPDKKGGRLGVGIATSPIQKHQEEDKTIDL